MRAMSRRDFLRLLGVLGTAGAAQLISGCAPTNRIYDGLSGAPAAPEPMSVALADFEALQRMTFGPGPAELRAVALHGLNPWIETQLAPAGIDDGALAWRLRRFDILDLQAVDIADLHSGLFDDVDSAGAMRQLREATLLRQIYSQRQLHEIMVAFWTDHFNIFIEKDDCWLLKPIDDRDVIRKHALGNFHELLRASSTSPAMLVYLDNQTNSADAPNENYARELLELHTLGVDGGYTQRDVMELARGLTGWTVKQPDKLWRGDFHFDRDAHDSEPKTVLGMPFGGGQAETERVIDALAAHPSTARFIAAKLVRRFVADVPPPALVERAARVFLRSNGDIASTLRSVLFDGLPQRAPKYKSPARLLTSALRALGVQTDGGPALHDMLQRMGQPLFGWATPDGYPDHAAAWQTSLLPRWQFALALGTGTLAGTSLALEAIWARAGARTPLEKLDTLATLLLGAPLARPVVSELLDAIDGHAPDFDAQAVAALVASPQFQTY